MARIEVRKRAKDGSFRGGARPGAGRKKKQIAQAPIEPSSIHKDDDSFAVELLSGVMRDPGKPLEMRVRAAVALLGRKTSSPAPDPND